MILQCWPYNEKRKHGHDDQRNASPTRHQLPDDHAELARVWLAGLRDAAAADGPPLDAETLASLDRGLADAAEGRVKSLDQYERERGL